MIGLIGIVLCCISVGVGCVAWQRVFWRYCHWWSQSQNWSVSLKLWWHLYVNVIPTKIRQWYVVVRLLLQAAMFLYFREKLLFIFVTDYLYFIQHVSCPHTGLIAAVLTYLFSHCPYLSSAYTVMSVMYLCNCDSYIKIYHAQHKRINLWYLRMLTSSFSFIDVIDAEVFWQFLRMWTVPVYLSWLFCPVLSIITYHSNIYIRTLFISTFCSVSDTVLSAVESVSNSQSVGLGR